MVKNCFVVFSARDRLLDRLREASPDRVFVKSDNATGNENVAIVDAATADALSAGNYELRIVLCDARPFPIERRVGEFRVLAESFEADPGEVLSWVEETAASGVRIAELETEVDFSRQVRELMTEVDLDRVGERIGTMILELLALEKGTLLLYDSGREKFVNLFTNDSAYQDKGEFLPGVPHSMLDGKERFATRVSSEEKPGLVVLPARVGEDLIGLFWAVIPAGEKLDEVKADLAALYLEATTAVLANFHRLTRSAELAMRDDLTKAFNRRFFESYLDQEIERSRRYGSGFSIIFLDLDDLKEVNNQHGHLMGSRTLQEVAKRVMGAVRAIDKVVRFGGDEFCIILPQTDNDKAESVAERVRLAISEAPFDLGPDICVKITASFGIATFPKHAVAKEDLIRVADSAMYSVKSTTKNAIKVAER